MRVFLCLLFAFNLIGFSSSPVFSQNNTKLNEGKSIDPPQLIPPQTFAAAGQMVRPKLSPDGLRMVHREQIGSNKLLTIRTIDSGKIERIRVPEKNTLNWYRWAGNNKIIVSVRGIATRGSREYHKTSMFSYDIATGSFNPVGRWQAVSDGDNVLYVDPDGTYLLQSIQAKSTEYPTVYRVSLADNKVSTVVYPQNRIWRWLADNSGIVRMGIAFRSKGLDIYYRSNADQKFELISKLRDKDSDEEREDSLLDIAGIVAGSDTGYVLSNKETGRFALYEFDYRTRALGKMILDHPENDISSYRLSEDGTALLSARYTDARDRIVWFDENYKQIQSNLEKALKGQEIWIQSRSKDRKKMIIYTTSSTDPGSYYLFQPDARKLDRLGGINDPIDPAEMAETKYVEYQARDGLMIKAYLTLPKGRIHKKLPLIILPHGGPYDVRDTWDYNAEVQFLANRGYAVFRPNFRGSGGYGEEFYTKGEGEIGRAMQNDLDDGMDWLIDQDIADAKRVCLIGSSYGGYAAMWGAIRNPERYRCAASFAGVTDLAKQLKYDRKFLRSRYAKEWKQTVQGDEEFDLDSVSPAYQISRLKRPLMLAHGKDDSRVPFSQYKKLVKAAKKADIPIDQIIYEDEGHGFSDRANEADWYVRLEAFLRIHNPAD
ncbi:alpha/beta fold hydrolase [Parasphingorhabdus sp.]|uniref:alpha/beta hydrolase family protein n=1 Tax=Parasphingorhabdus sp. TaxID=2709688 RepID=UPI003263133B